MFYSRPQADIAYSPNTSASSPHDKLAHGSGTFPQKSPFLLPPLPRITVQWNLKAFSQRKRKGKTSSCREMPRLLKVVYIYKSGMSMSHPRLNWGGGSRKSYIDIKKVDIRCWKRKVSAYWGHLKTMVELGGELEDCGFFSSRGR